MSENISSLPVDTNTAKPPHLPSGKTGCEIKKGRGALLLLFAVAMLLRILLGFFNEEANDNHVDVVRWIVDKHELPGKDDCWSCYQPKLYYVVCAGLVKFFNLHAFHRRVVAMQLVNVFISLFILLLFWKFIDKQHLKERSKYLAFAFFAFNPCLAGINAQGTNDTLVIFFGILAVYACDSFFKEMKMIPALVLIISLVAGALTKASAIVLTGAIGIVFLIKILAEYPGMKKRVTAKYFLLLVISLLAIVPFAGGYYRNYKQDGSFTISTWKEDAPPRFFQTTHVERPGLMNMFTGFFTFRYFDMIRQPYINNAWNDYPRHRTSLWSQLYGRTLFMHFDQWPPSWQSQEKIIVGIGRILIILGIVPLALFLTGLLGLFGLVKNLLRKNRDWLAAPDSYLHHIITLAFLTSSVVYTYHYRDFSSMKSIYIFPGLLSFIRLTTDGLAPLRFKIVASIVEVVLIAIIILSIADIVFLIYQLY